MAINWTNITTPADLLAVPNANTSGSFWALSLYMIWVVMILIFSTISIEVALLTASFIALVASIFLTYAGLIAWENTLFFIGWIVFTILYVVWSTKND